MFILKSTYKDLERDYADLWDKFLTLREKLSHFDRPRAKNGRFTKKSLVSKVTEF